MVSSVLLVVELPIKSLSVIERVRIRSLVKH